jgi:cardiolipin synthase
LSLLTGHAWWLLVLAGFGVLGIATAVVSLFFSLGRRPRKLMLTEAPSVESEAFLVGIAGAVNAPLVSGGSARLLNNGVEIFPALLQALRGAKRSINFMTYIWESGRVSDAILDVLIERARAGVEVRVMLDTVGAFRAPRKRFRELVDAGGKVHWFRLFQLGKLTRFHKRNHRRAIIIDGRIGFTGGAAVADKWLGDAQDEEHWRDMMVEFTGCIPSNLQSAFTQLWASSKGEILLGEAFYPPPEAAARETPGGERLSKHINVISSPADEAHPLRKVFWTSLRCARERIYLTSPYFVPDADTRRVVADRARHGVDVRILLPNRLTDARPIRQASHSYYDELLSAGVRIYEYQRAMIHSKTMVVDGAWSVVGSANMDIRSRELNQENVVGILDRGFAEQMEKTFLDDLKDAREIRLEEWRRRGPGKRILERFFVLFAEQY